MDVNHYEVLGVEREATPEQIRDAYRRLVREHHPDANPERREESEIIIKGILAAYAVLIVPEKRARYDLELLSAPYAAPAAPSAPGAASAPEVVHRPRPKSLLTRVREANGFSIEEISSRLGLSETVFQQMEERDAVPQTPVQLRTLTHLTEQAAKALEWRGDRDGAESLRQALNRKKTQRAIFR